MKTLSVLALLSLCLATLNVVKAEQNIVVDEEPSPSSDEPISFTFAAFSQIDRDSLKFMFDSNLQDNAPGVELTPWNSPLVNATVDGDERGKVFYKDSIQMKGKTGHKTVSFSTSFTFVIKSENYSHTGDGLAFVLVADPYFEGDGGGQFSIFKDGAVPSPTIAVEFDTFMNEYLMDIDANHVGVDIDSALSYFSASASAVNISLQDGRPITAWIDYRADRRDIEVRISNDSTKPTDALISGTLDLSSILSSKMWVGFSASTHMLAHQSHDITYWTFECESLSEGGNSLLERLKRFWQTSSSYAVVAVGAAVVVLLIVCVISCCCGCPCCRKYCPCFAKCCSCCPRWCPCHLCTKTDGRQEQTKTGDKQEKQVPTKCTCCCPSLPKCTCCPCLPKCTCPRSSCSSCKCSCRSDCGLSPCSKCHRGTETPSERTTVPDERERKEKPCPLAFLELIQENVSQEKGMDLTLPDSIRSCLPLENPFSTKQVVQPGCISSLLFGAESGDELEAEAPAPDPSRPLGNLMLVSNTVFDILPEEICQCPQPCDRECTSSSAAECLVGDNCLIDNNAKQQRRAEMPQAPQREPRGREKRRSTESESVATASYDFTPEERIVMGWGYFSP